MHKRKILLVTRDFAGFLALTLRKMGLRCPFAIQMPTFNAHKPLLIGESFMAADTVVRARIDVKTKAQAVSTLRAMGLTVSDAIRLLLVQVAADEKLPFLVKVPEPPRRRPMAKSGNFPKGLSQ